jgi:succinate dehydrogenase / fumarate reductase membrane anchor subunit
MMSGHEKGLRTPLKRVRGLGSAKEGVQHWWQTRLTSVALIPLSLWFIFSVLDFTKDCDGLYLGYYHATVGSMALCQGAYQDTLVWISQPLNAFLLILLTGIMFQHAASGIQVVLEDYVHSEGRKLVSIYAVKALCLLMGGACILSILKIALGHA